LIGSSIINPFNIYGLVVILGGLICYRISSFNKEKYKLKKC